MALSTILNLVSCAASAVLGTGTKGCKPFLKNVTSIWLLPTGTKLDGTRDLTEEYVKELQATGKVIVLKGIQGFTDSTPEDTTEQLESGVKQITALGLYEFLVNFINGLYFHSALHALSGYGNYDAIFIDRDGSILGTMANDGSLKGFTCGMVQATKIQWATNAAAGREGLMLQLTERAELDQSYVYIQASQLDFNPNRIDGINEVVVSYPSVPTDASTTIGVKVVTKQDSKPLTGLDYTDFLVTKNGATANPTAATESSGVYTLTVAALATNDEIATQIYDNIENRNVIDLDGDLYKSNEATVVVI